MSVFRIDDKLVFPHPDLAEPDGLLAVGGDLSVDRLILAYSNGIFPWYNEKEEPILWWSTDPRCVLFPKEFRTTKSLKQSIRKNNYKFSVNRSFGEVIRKCANISREGQDGTWIGSDMQVAYQDLNENGFAWSVETWKDNKLAGGFYGVKIGRLFSGESMFHEERDASKAALMFLCTNAEELNIDLIDVQQSTSHLISMGARDISRKDFLCKLAEMQDE